MAGDADALAGDLGTLGERLGDDRFCAELYRALAGNVWVCGEEDPGRRVELTWAAAERLVNGLRATVGAAPLVLVQTGGEGAVSHAVDAELRRLGWTHPRPPR